MKKNGEFEILSCFTIKSVRLLFHLYYLSSLLRNSQSFSLKTSVLTLCVWSLVKRYAKKRKKTFYWNCLRAFVSFSVAVGKLGG